MHDRFDDVAGKRGGVVGNKFGRNIGNRDCFRNLNLLKRGNGIVHAGQIHLDDVIAFFLEAFLNGFLDVADGFVNRNDIGELEERHLHYGIDTGAESGVFGNLQRIDIVEVDLLFNDRFLHIFGQVVEHFL